MQHTYQKLSLRSRFAKFLIRTYITIARRDKWTLEQRRKRIPQFSKRYLKLPRNLVSEKVDVDGIPGEWIYFPEDKPERTILYLHGGGYVMCCIESHRHLIAQIARAARACVLAIDYRLAPEHPYPAALEDAFRAYNRLLANGTDAQQLAIAGDSAGGGLAVCLSVKLRDEGFRLPAAVACLSPWVDLTVSGDSIKTKANEEIIVPVQYIKMGVEAYLNGANPKSPTISPIFADLSGLPPMLIQVGTSEILLDDARRLAVRAEADGVETTLEVWEGMIHVWHFFSDYIPEARAAIEHIGQFVQQQIPTITKHHTDSKI